jgi:hypothetical protein
MTAHAALAAVAASVYVALFAVLVFGTHLFGGPETDQPVLVYAVLLNVGVGLLVGQWWAVLLPVLPMAMPFLPFAPEQYEGPFVQLQALFAMFMGALVGVGVAARKVARRVLA